MERQKTDYLWIGVFGVLVAFAIPWFLWGDARTWLGLPLWLWWHIGWMGLASLTFALFTRRGWDRLMNVEPDEVGFDG
ncbi:DUF3311 domain-containing protein [Halobellus captivus]|uniref:DUF3311 domain-containing protein n=1 Tax=Halobellus captivus TaxID=2592614 RepID=UPI0011A1D7E4|nr:DUF3311 domain-containing protein [Halobellus captivus]